MFARVTAPLLVVAGGLVLAAVGLRSGTAAAGDGPDDEATRIEQVKRDAVDLLDNDGCVDCHPGVAREWEGSLHRRSYTNSAFQASHQREPLPFCQTCHAPRAEQFPAEAKAAEAGIDCVTCHVQDGQLVAGPGPSQHAAPHMVVRRPELGAPEGCGDCHQFEFPRKAGRRPGALMQQTLNEHAGSDLSAMDCADCHMDTSRQLSDGRRGRNHGFDVSRNEAFMRDALLSEASRPRADQLALTLEPNAVGHFFPTGDLFRRLEIVVEARRPSGELVHREQKYLARHFPAEGSGRFFPDEPDDRLRGRTTFEFDLPGASSGDEIRWKVTYQRVGERDPARPHESEVVGAIELATGTL